MNILQLRGEFTDNGPGTQTLTIGEELRNRGHKVFFCSSGGKLETKIRDKQFTFLKIEEIAYEKRNLINVLISIHKLSKILKQKKIEIVHCHNAATSVIAWFSKLIAQRKVKIFQSVRGVEIRKNYGWRNWIYLLGTSNKLFAVCERAKEILIGFGVKSSKIITTYNGVDLKRFDIGKRDEYRKLIRTELRIPDDAIVIGIIGRQDGLKGHRHLIKAFKKIYNRYSNLYVILVGEGKELEINKKLANDLGIIPRARFTGLRLDVEKIHASFDIFTLLSEKGYEMFPNAIIESLSYANCAVVSNTQGVPETIQNGAGIVCECGDINSFADAFSKLIENPNLMKKMGQQARINVENLFNIGAVTDKLLEAYKNEL